ADDALRLDVLGPLVAENAAVGELDRDEEAAVLAGAQRVDDDAHLVAELDGIRLPALLDEVVGAVHLDAPRVDAAFAVGHRQLNRGGRVLPRDLLDGPGERAPLRPTKQAGGVMRARRFGNEQHGDENGGYAADESASHS